MRESDRGAFSKSLLTLADVFRATVTSDLAEVYYHSLSEYELEDVQRAMTQTVREARWFPKPLELRQMIESGLEREYQHKIHAWNDAQRAERGDD
jgi:hypothetical protein